MTRGRVRRGVTRTGLPALDAPSKGLAAGYGRSVLTANGVVPKGGAFLEAAHYLRRLAEELSAFPPEGQVAAPGSRASIEAADGSFDGPWGRGTIELLHEPSARLILAIEYLRGLAALTEADRVTVGIVPMIRPALVTFGHLYYLFDPEIDVRERVRRRFNLRLASLVEELMITRVLASEDYERTAKDILDLKWSAGQLGFDYITRKRRKGQKQPSTRYLGRPVPSEGQIVAEVLQPMNATFGPAVYRLTSAVTHAQMHGLKPFLHDPVATSEADVVTAQIGMTLRMFTALTGSVVYAAHVATTRVASHFGWDAASWTAGSEAALAAWDTWLNTEPIEASVK